METKRHFFILGLPRSRTAWLSMLLTDAQTFCFHEGAGSFPTWDAFAAALKARPEPCSGDSNAALFAWIEELVRDFPDAAFIVIRRDADECRESFCAAAPHSEGTIRAGWAEYVRLFEAALQKLPSYMEVPFAELNTLAACDAICQHATGRALDEGRWRKLRGLRVTADIPAPPVPVPQRFEVPVVVGGFDFAGLTVRAYSPQDRPMLAAWYEHHKDESFPQVRLPPLGIVVEDAEGPVAAVWCFETYGVGVAWIALPVTRPGLTYARASTVLAFAIMAITKLAGRSYVPPATFDCFRVICPPSMGKLLRRIGFTEQPGRSNYFLST